MSTSPSPSEPPRGRRLALKVHRVATVGELRQLEDLSVDYLGLDVDDDACFHIDPEPFWGDERYVCEDSARDQLLPAYRRARPFVECAREALSPDLVARLAASGVMLIQVEARRQLDPAVAASAAAHGIRFIGRLSLEPEDKPLLDQLTRPELPGLAVLDVQLFPSYGDAWSFLVDTAPTHAGDVVTLEDLRAVAARVPLHVSVNATPRSVRTIVATLASLGVAGLSFTLSPSAIGSFHTVELEALLATLAALQAQGS
jgi:hypothetical protein